MWSATVGLAQSPSQQLHVGSGACQMLTVCCVVFAWAVLQGACDSFFAVLTVVILSCAARQEERALHDASPHRTSRSEDSTGFRQSSVSHQEDCQQEVLLGHLFPLSLLFLQSVFQDACLQGHVHSRPGLPDVQFRFPFAIALVTRFHPKFVQVQKYFTDLRDEDYVSRLAIVHSRYSTNTFPSWERAQPFRYLSHNGEINTLTGNVNWQRCRESVMER